MKDKQPNLVITKTPEVATSAVLVRNVPKQLRRDFKALCARRGTNMTEHIHRLMRQAVESEKK